MNGATASVIFVMSHYDVHCDISTRGSRILDMFNDQTTQFLDLENVRVFQRTATEPMFELPKSVLAKANIHLAILVSEDRSNESKVFFAARERKSMDAVILLPTVLVTGQLHPKLAHDPQGYLTLEAGSFIPVTAAKVYGHCDAGSNLESSVVVVKKDAISSLSWTPL